MYFPTFREKAKTCLKLCIRIFIFPRFKEFTKSVVEIHRAMKGISLAPCKCECSVYRLPAY